MSDTSKPPFIYTGNENIYPPEKRERAECVAVDAPHTHFIIGGETSCMTDDGSRCRG